MASAPVGCGDAADPMATYLATLVVGQFTLIEQTGPNGLPILHAAADSISEEVATETQDTARMIDYFDDFFGPYPFATYGLIALPVPIGFALETQTRSLFGSDLFSLSSIRAHELAHQKVVRLTGVSERLDLHLAQRRICNLRRMDVGRGQRRPVNRISGTSPWPKSRTRCPASRAWASMNFWPICLRARRGHVA